MSAISRLFGILGTVVASAFLVVLIRATPLPSASGLAASTPAPQLQPVGASAQLASGVTLLPVDALTKSCAGDRATRLAVLSLHFGGDFRTLFPAAGIAPELDHATQPLLVVVYRDGYPGVTLGAIPPGNQTAGTPASAGHIPAPGTWDVCVETVNGDRPFGGPSIVYGSISQRGSLISAP